MRLPPRLSVSAICTLGWDLERDLAYWRSAGIGHVGVSVAKLRAAGWDRAVSRVAGAGLQVSNLIGPGPFTLWDRSAWDGQRRRLEEMLEAAAAMSAGCLVVTTGPSGSLEWEEAADRLEEAMAPVLAGGPPVPVALEHTNSLRPDIGFLHTLRDAVELARRLGIGVCMETNACWLERGLAGTVAEGVGVIRLVQLSDYVIGTTRTPDRAVPGDGDIPLGRIVSQLLGAGYSGPFDLELVGPAIEAEGYESAIARSVEALSSLLPES